MNRKTNLTQEVWLNANYCTEINFLTCSCTHYLKVLPISIENEGNYDTVKRRLELKLNKEYTNSRSVLGIIQNYSASNCNNSRLLC